VRSTSNENTVERNWSTSDNTLVVQQTRKTLRRAGGNFKQLIVLILNLMHQWIV